MANKKSLAFFAWLAAGLLALFFGGCVSEAMPAIADQPIALLERPERPVLPSAEQIQMHIQNQDMDSLTIEFARAMAEMVAYARQLEALLDSVERQNRILE